MCSSDLDEAVDRVATGQIFTAQQAVEAGLVDRIGFLDDAVKRAAELAGLAPDKARAVRYSRPRSLLQEVVDGNVAAETRAFGGRGALEAFAELTTPRAWYLCSWWPALVASR